MQHCSQVHYLQLCLALPITLMSIERYIACVHSFRLHQIMTKQIVLFVLSFSWVIATISGILAVATNKDIQAEVAVGESVVFKLTLVICSFSTSLIITIIQIRLLMFSRSKLGDGSTIESVRYPSRVGGFSKEAD